MNWMERILSSDAAKASPEAAKRIIEAAGGSVPSESIVSSPDNDSVSEPSAAATTSNND